MRRQTQPSSSMVPSRAVQPGQSMAGVSALPLAFPRGPQLKTLPVLSA